MHKKYNWCEWKKKQLLRKKMYLLREKNNCCAKKNNCCAKNTFSTKQHASSSCILSCHFIGIYSLCTYLILRISRFLWFILSFLYLVPVGGPKNAPKNNDVIIWGMPIDLKNQVISGTEILTQIFIISQKKTIVVQNKNNCCTNKCNYCGKKM